MNVHVRPWHSLRVCVIQCLFFFSFYTINLKICLSSDTFVVDLLQYNVHCISCRRPLVLNMPSTVLTLFVFYLQRLHEKRSEESRVENIDELSLEQLIEEKTAIQRGLLYLESLFGRPNSREERDAARPLYDRYRSIKRLVNRNNSLSGGGAGELPTILENEALALTTGVVSPSNEDDSPPTDVQSPPSESSTSISGPDMSDPNDTNDAIGSINETIKLMSIDKLWIQLDIVREEKKQLRRSLKEFEYKFEETSGRKMLKSDRKAMEDTYTLYKQKKSKLRLLDALVKKQINN